MKLSEFVIELLRPSEQDEVKELILAGLVEHWGFLDPNLNPDLKDIQKSYQNATFLVARHRNKVVGCGALVPRDIETAEIVRVSVHSLYRRYGLGTQIIKQLLEVARKQGYSRIILETTASWTEVVAFYLHNGFQITHQDNENIYFIMDLNPKDIQS